MRSTPHILRCGVSYAADMATLEDVRRLALALPGAVEDSGRGGLASWRVAKKLFVWERPLGKSDLAALGDDAPHGTIVGVRTADLGVKEALIADDPAVFFTTPHFHGYPAVLIRLDVIEVDELAEVVEEAWLNRAPPKVAAAHLAADR
jgi:hypothetical protein